MDATRLRRRPAARGGGLCRRARPARCDRMVGGPIRAPRPPLWLALRRALTPTVTTLYSLCGEPPTAISSGTLRSLLIDARSTYVGDPRHVLANGDRLRITHRLGHADHLDVSAWTTGPQSLFVLCRSPPRSVHDRLSGTRGSGAPKLGARSPSRGAPTRRLCSYPGCSVQSVERTEGASKSRSADICDHWNAALRG